MSLLSEGKYPPEVKIDEAANALRVTKGSLYQHFRNADDWYAAVITRWAEDRTRDRDQVGSRVHLIQDPLDRLRFLRRGADANAVPDRAMRSWAATATSFRPLPGAVLAAEALEQVRQPVLEGISVALTDLGLAGSAAAVMARVLVSEFGFGPGQPAIPPGDDAGFDTLLAVTARAVRDDLLSATEVEIAEADQGSESVVMCIVTRVPSGRGGQPDLKQLAAQARQFAQRHFRPMLAAPGETAPETAAATAGTEQPG
jgi:AcrR family transcriptional regulator